MSESTVKPPPVAILRRPQVEVRTGLSRSTIYARIQDGTFPRPILLGSRSVGWLEHEIDDWFDRRIKFSRSAGPRSSTHD
jgi:prophage regulatory protein